MQNEVDGKAFLGNHKFSRMLVHLASHQYRVFLVRLSTFVLYRHLSTHAKLEFNPGVAPGVPADVKMKLVAVKTAKMNARTAELAEEHQAACRLSVNLLRWVEDHIGVWRFRWHHCVNCDCD